MVGVSSRHSISSELRAPCGTATSTSAASAIVNSVFMVVSLRAVACIDGTTRRPAAHRGNPGFSLGACPERLHGCQTRTQRAQAGCDHCVRRLDAGRMAGHRAYELFALEREKLDVALRADRRC